jgi:hypothetical protein
MAVNKEVQESVTIEKTLAILKPDAVKKNVIGKIISRIEDEGFKITAMRLAKLTKDEAKGFYVVHKDKSFYGPLDRLHVVRPGRAHAPRTRERDHPLAQGHGGIRDAHRFRTSLAANLKSGMIING